ncbi:MAG TPA: hypothetical protein VF046_00320, partial [Gemmatimonadales bacterium]
MPKLGVIGSLVWDLIHGRDPLAVPTEEWGGIAYALGGLDASLSPDWEIVPLIKVGRDLAPRAAELLGSLSRLTPGGRCVEVPAPNNRVVLHYQSAERRTERMSGGVPAWTWLELGPMVRDLDAIYLNFISGFELTLGTAQALRRGFDGPIYADLHSLFLGMQHDGLRVRQPLPDAAEWLRCFDVVQLNEDEMRQMSSDPLALSADALAAGVSLLIVTLGAKGAAYVAAPGFEGWQVDGRAGGRPDGRAGGRPDGRTAGRNDSGILDQPNAGAPVRQSARPPVRPSAARTALIPAPVVDAADPTGCGDVFGAVAFARMLAGDPMEDALQQAVALAARNATLRGAGG